MTLDHANGSPLLEEEEETGLPLPTPRPSRSLFGFGSLPGSEEELLAGENPLGGLESDFGTEWGSGEQPQPLEDDDPDSDPTSSAESSRADRPAALLSKQQMRATARQAVTIGTGMAHTVAAKSEAQKAVGLFLADEDDAANIGNPLGDLMHRRGDVVGGKLSPDANDFLRSLMGIAGYLTKQIHKVAVVRQIEGGHQAAEAQNLDGAA